MAEAPDEIATKLPSTPVRNASSAAESSVQDASVEEHDDGDEEEDDGPEEEPKLKYHRLTDSIKSVYKSGDATSTFLVSGDKLVWTTA
jgi:hypothetical protein